MVDLMLALQGEAEAHGAIVALRSPVEGGRADNDGVLVRVGGTEPVDVLAKTMVIAVGLDACRLGRAFSLLDVPTLYLCKGRYFGVVGRPPFQRLIYPLPGSVSLGLHFSSDLAGQGRFGPDVEWIETENYDVGPAQAALFYPAIARYWPGVAGRVLQPAYASIRPKIHAPSEPRPDFMVVGPQHHGIPGVIALFGIESPGLTASLALADHVKNMDMPA